VSPGHSSTNLPYMCGDGKGSPPCHPDPCAWRPNPPLLPPRPLPGALPQAPRMLHAHLAPPSTTLHASTSTPAWSPVWSNAVPSVHAASLAPLAMPLAEIGRLEACWPCTAPVEAGAACLEGTAGLLIRGPGCLEGPAMPSRQPLPLIAEPLTCGPDGLAAALEATCMVEHTVSVAKG